MTLYVVFTHLDHSKITKFEKLPFDEAVKLTNELEMEMREKKKEIAGEFHLISDDGNGEAIYSGTYNFGSYFAPNIFIHIKKKLPNIKTDKEKAQKRNELIEQMEGLIDDEYKQEEDLDQNMPRNIDEEKISRLKKWQRRTVYGIAVFFALAFIGSVSFFLIKIASFNNEFQALEEQNSKQEKLVTYYENALLDKPKSLKKYLSSKKPDELNTEETQIYAQYLAEADEFEKLTKLFNGDAAFAANFLSKNASIEKLKAYNELHPTNEAKFDIAYAENNYNDVVSMEDVEMTKERSRKMTYALLQTGDIEGAKKQLGNNNDSELASKVEKYEQLNKKIADLNKKIADAKDDKKDNLKDKKQKLEKEQKEI